MVFYNLLWLTQNMFHVGKIHICRKNNKDLSM